MKEIRNIESYRKKRKLKKGVRRFLTFLLVFAFGLACIWGYKWYTSAEIPINTENRATKFPIKLKGDVVHSAEMMGSSLSVLTDKEYSIYSSKGSTVQTVSHGYASPSMKCSSKRSLIYDIGGTKFSVESKAGNVFSFQMDNKILFGEVAENGCVAIVTQDDRYQCRLTVFDETGQEKFKWYAAGDLVTALDFTDGDNGCIITAINTVEGIVSTTVYGLQFSETQQRFSTKLPTTMAISTSVKAGNNIHVIADDRMVILSPNGEVLKTEVYPKKLKFYSDTSSKYTVVLFGEEVKSNNTVIVYDANGAITSQLEFNDKVRDMFSDGSHVVVLTDKQILCYNMLMKLGDVLDNKSGIHSIVGSGNTGYTISSSAIEKFMIG